MELLTQEDAKTGTFILYLKNEITNLKTITVKCAYIKINNGIQTLGNFLLNHSIYTRGICKVLSMVFNLSNRLTNLIVFAFILKRYFSSMLWHKFDEDIIMQTQKILL